MRHHLSMSHHFSVIRFASCILETKRYSIITNVIYLFSPFDRYLYSIYLVPYLCNRRLSRFVPKKGSKMDPFEKQGSQQFFIAPVFSRGNKHHTGQLVNPMFVINQLKGPKRSFSYTNSIRPCQTHY